MVGLCPAGRERAPHDFTRVAKLHAQLADQETLDLTGKRRVSPGGELRIESRRQRICGHAHRGRGGVEQTEVTRMAVVYLMMAKALEDPIQRLTHAHGGAEIDVLQELPHRSRIGRGSYAKVLELPGILLDRALDSQPHLVSKFVGKLQHGIIIGPSKIGVEVPIDAETG